MQSQPEQRPTLHQHASSNMSTRSEPSQSGVEMTISPLGHALFLGLIVLPFAVAPYIAITNRLKAMDGAIQGVSAALAATRGELRAAVRESAVRREEHRLLEKAGHALRSDFGHLRAQLHKARLDLKAMETRQRTAAAAGTQQLREQQEALGALGDSLGDVATFMHEVELRRGWLDDSTTSDRGVANLRRVGMQLQALKQAKSERKLKTEPATEATPIQEEIPPLY